MKENLKPTYNKKAKLNSRARLKRELIREDWEHFNDAVLSGDAIARKLKPVRKFVYR